MWHVTLLLLLLLLQGPAVGAFPEERKLTDSW
jgi:hypothetical protein